MSDVVEKREGVWGRKQSRGGFGTWVQGHGKRNGGLVELLKKVHETNKILRYENSILDW